MYRKQVRRRRAVLALLVISSFVLLTITYGQGSGGLQRSVSTIFSPLQDGADRALKPARDLVGWFDKTFDARGENSQLKDELVQTRELAVGGQAALQENEQLRKLLKLDRGPAIAASGYKPVTGARDRPHADGLALGGDDRPRQRRRRPRRRPGDERRRRWSAGSPRSRAGSVAGDADHRQRQRDLGEGPAERRAGRDPPRPRRPRGPDPRLHRRDRERSTSARRWSPRAGAPRASPRCFPPNLPIGEVTRASIVEQEASQQVRLRPYADLANLDIVQVLTGGPER